MFFDEQYDEHDHETRQNWNAKETQVTTTKYYNLNGYDDNLLHCQNRPVSVPAVWFVANRLKATRKENRNQQFAFETGLWQWKRRNERLGNETYQSYVFKTHWELVAVSMNGLEHADTNLLRKLDVMVEETMREGNFGSF